MTKTTETPTPLTDALQAQWLAYREWEEEWGEDARKRPNTEMHELAQLLEKRLTDSERKLADLLAREGGDA